MMIHFKISIRSDKIIGFKSNFTILDTDDQKKLIRKICEAENIDAKKNFTTVYNCFN